MNTHPGTGRRYIHIFPSAPFLQEIRNCYEYACRRLPWMDVDDLDGWSTERPEWFIPELVLVFWALLPDRAPADRTAAYAFRYTESAGDPELLAETQVAAMGQFAFRASEPDIVLCGNPVIADYWSRLCRAVAVVPSGYEREILGVPNWEAPKSSDLVFYGSDIGRRSWILGAVSEKFGNGFVRIGDYGFKRKRSLDSSRANLYIGHSSDYAFPGTRLWHAISSSAVLISERRDAWPAIPGRHYIELEPARLERPGTFAGQLTEVLDQEPLEEVARTAHEELSLYTIDRCMEEFLVPATKGLSR